MVEITVSNDNFNALLGAMPHEMVCVKHKNLKGEIWLEKKYHKMPKPSRNLSNNFDIVPIESATKYDFTDKVLYLMKQGYKVSSTYCTGETWRAIMIKEVDNND